MTNTLFVQYLIVLILEIPRGYLVIQNIEKQFKLHSFIVILLPLPCFFPSYSPTYNLSYIYFSVLVLLEVCC